MMIHHHHHHPTTAIWRHILSSPAGRWVADEEVVIAAIQMDNASGLSAVVRENPPLAYRRVRGRSPLVRACARGAMQCLEVLLEAIPPVHVNGRTRGAFDDGDCPLIVASSQGNDKVVARLLLAPGICVNQRDATGATALLRAIEGGSIRVVALLLLAQDFDLEESFALPTPPPLTAKQKQQQPSDRPLVVVGRTRRQARVAKATQPPATQKEI